MAVAPHSGFLDMLVICLTGLPTVVSRDENTKLPVVGGEKCIRYWESLTGDEVGGRFIFFISSFCVSALLEFDQAVLVSRKDPESRKKCVSQIKERLTSDGYWPQV